MVWTKSPVMMHYTPPPSLP